MTEFELGQIHAKYDTDEDVVKLIVALRAAYKEIDSRIYTTDCLLKANVGLQKWVSELVHD